VPRFQPKGMSRPPEGRSSRKSRPFRTQHAR
jgi:hypothetical protein